MHAGIAHLLTLAMASTGGANANADFSVVEKDSVQIESSVHAHLYTWVITNKSRRPIVRFEIPQHNTYNQQVPPGWTYTFADERFAAWASKSEFAIQPGKKGAFTARGSSEGGIIGVRPALVANDTDDGPIQFEAVWAPVAKPRWLVWLIAGVIGALALLHVAVIARRPVHQPPLE